VSARPLDRSQHLAADARGLLDHEASVAEGDDADLDGLGLRLHEGSSRRLGCVDAGGLEILGAHAVRHVEGEDDGALLPGQAQRHLRAGERDEQQDEADQEEGEGHVKERTAAAG